MTVLEHIKSLTHTLTPEQREELSNFLNRPNGRPKAAPVSLRGTLKDKFPEDFDPTEALHEIRSGWKRKLDL